CPPFDGKAVASVELERGGSDQFSMVPAAADLPAPTGRSYHQRADGSIYLRWDNHFEFMIAADGRQIACRPLGTVTGETFDSYLPASALSFALVRQGIEPLHATVVDVGGKAVGFLGNCGFGKSSLATWFIRRGHRLITDDLLVVSFEGRTPLAY